ncbi:hypothetical protein [Halovenus sp. HT40]|uniref:hypothetical protein n=1 Tax=Halovenus sp. HT40 TaxID=3126691 RepID=UPI00300EFF18
MLDATLHTGIEHPNLLWIGLSSLLSFGAGVAVERYRDDSTYSTEPTVDTE